MRERRIARRNGSENEWRESSKKVGRRGVGHDRQLQMQDVNDGGGSAPFQHRKLDRNMILMHLMYR